MTKKATAKGLTKEQREIWAAIRTAAARVQGSRNAVLHPAGISVSEFDILHCLYLADGNSLRMSDLAAGVFQSRSRITHTVGRLEKRGLLTRELYSKDRRGVTAALTKTGLEVLKSLISKHDETIERTVLRPLDATDLANIKTVLSKIL